TVDAGARERGYPGLLSRIARWLAAQRFDIDWEAVDYLRRADEFRVPILLFHGAVDDLVPVETSDRLAELRPDLVTYVRVAKAQHVRSWNVAPEAYARAVGEFLERVAP
ncbi:MAG: alpha/beta hydrolase, partial [Dehalococcoidia bacterium]